MSTAASGQISFGVLIDAYTELPWTVGKWENDHDIENWWIYDACGYENPYEMFENGKWINGERWNEEAINYYYDARREFAESHPLPAIWIIFSFDSCEMDSIIALPQVGLGNEWGYPERFDPLDLKVNQHDIQKLLDFCKEYNIKYKDGPAWRLSSLYG